MKMLRGSRLAAILLGVVSVVYAVGYFLQPHQKGRRLFDRLSAQIQEGDTRESVFRMLGSPDKRYTEENIKEFLRSTKTLAEQRPDLFPEDHKPVDEIVVYFVDWNSRPFLYMLRGGETHGEIRLQFRGGRLVNHNPDFYSAFENTRKYFVGHIA